MKINMSRLQTFSTFSGARAYLQAMVRAIPEARTRELADLKQFAESQHWPYEDYDCERQELESLFQYTMPSVLSRSFLVYLYSIVEVQLYSVADGLRERRQIELRPTELAGSAIEKVKVYFAKVLGLSVSSDYGWAQMRDLAILRNAIVHRGARLGDDPQERQRLKRVAALYPGVTFSRGGWARELSEIEASAETCLNFTDAAESFFDRLFVQSGLGHTMLVGSEESLPEG